MLYLYKNITPNKNGWHYYFTTYEKYLEGLHSNLIGELDNKNYIIENENILRLQGNNYVNLSYIVWENNGIYRFYYVENQTFVSGYSIFELSRDYWADYILDVKKNIFYSQVTRCSLPSTSGEEYRGIQDLEQTSTGTPEYSQLDLFDNEQVLIFFNVEYSYTKTTIFTNEAITASKLLYVTSSLNKLFENVTNISNIYNIQKLGETTSHEAGTTGIWVVPKPKEFTPSNEEYFNPMYKYIKSDGTITEGGLACATIKECLIETDFEVTKTSNKKVYFGTKDNYFNLMFNNNNVVNLRYSLSVNSSNVKVGIYQYDKFIDFTNELEFNTVTNNGTFTQQQQTALALSNIFNLVGGVVNTGAAVYSGNIPQFLTGTGQTLQSINSIFEQKHGKVNYKNSDGYNNWAPSVYEMSENVRTYKGNPFYMIQYDTIEQYYYDYVGYKTNLYLGQGKIFDLIPVGYSGFIQANLNFNGLNIDVQEYFKNKFLNGVYILNIGG